MYDALEMQMQYFR